MINSRKLEDLHLAVQPRIRQWLARCEAAGIDVLITSTYRDAESQAALYAQGRTAPGPKVTNAKPGQSFHNYRLAADFVPIVGGKPRWDDRGLFLRIGQLAEGCGLEWAGRWTRFPELAHVQWTGGLSLADLQAGKAPPERT